MATPDSHTVVMTLATPLGGFLQAATQPIAPAHLLADTPVGLLAQHPFGRQPIGSGPFAVISLDEDTAELVPSVSIMPPADGGGSGGGPGSSAAASDPLASAPPSEPPSGPSPYLAGIEMTFYDTPEELASAYRAGSLDAASGLPAATAGGLATGPGSRVIRYPSSTMTAVLLNLRPGHAGLRRPEGPDRAPRRDRPAGAHHDGLRGHGQQRQRSDPAELAAVRLDGGPAGGVRRGRRPGRAQGGRLDRRPPTAGGCPRPRSR